MMIFQAWQDRWLSGEVVTPQPGVRHAG